MRVTDLAPPAAGASPDAPASAVWAARTALRRAAPALLLYAAVRTLGIAVLALWAHLAGRDAEQLLSRRWDSLWYAGIAENGYGYTLYLDDGRIHSNLAFFPLLPGLERLLAETARLSVPAAGLLVSAVASLAAAWGLFAIGDRLYGHRAGLLLAALWAALPVGIVQSMAYSESLFTALASWSVYAVLTGRWITAGTLAMAAGLTRPSGLAVAAAVVVTAGLALARPGEGPFGERLGAGAVRSHGRILLGALLAPLGWLGYVAWVGVRTGNPLGYLEIQSQWGNGFDGGWAFANFIVARLTGDTAASFAAGVGLCAAVALVAWALALVVRQRQPVPVLVYCLVVVGLAVCGSGYFGSKPRLLMPAFPLLLPAAVALARVRPGRTAAVLVGAAVVSAVYGALWLHGSGPP